MIYGEIQPKDIASLFKVRTSTVENAFTLEALHAWGITEESVSTMLQSTHQGWLCEIDGRVVGFSMGDTSTGELWVIAVLPDFEGRGIGAKLLGLVEKALWTTGAKELWLDTSTDRALRAYSFYRSHGWKEAEVTGENLRMKKQRPISDK